MLKVIIDDAQSFDSTYKCKTYSNIEDIFTTLFPLPKYLGCFGDARIVFANENILLPMNLFLTQDEILDICEKI